MSSTNKTANLGLNQWVLTDPFNMADFNADNAAIDAAVGANPMVKLMDVTLATAVNAVELDLSGIDLTKFAQLQLYCRNSDVAYFYLRLNNSSENYSYMNSNGNWQTGGSCCSISFGGGYVVGLATDNIYLSPVHPGSQSTYKPTTAILPSALQTLNLIRDVSFSTTLYPVGTRFVLLGVKL